MTGDGPERIRLRGLSANQHFTLVPNDFVRDNAKSPLKSLDRMILIFLMSHADTWEMNRPQIDRAVSEGRDAVDAALKRLEQYGYLRRSRIRAVDGLWTWFWDFTFDPVEQPIPPPPKVADHALKSRGWKRPGRTG